VIDYERPLTLIDIEVRLYELSGELDAATVECADHEYTFHLAEAKLEVAKAKSFLSIDPMDRKITVDEKKAKTISETSDLIIAHAEAKARIMASRRNCERLRVQIDIARSQGSLIKSSMELS
jgi:hypothetical protein